MILFVDDLEIRHRNFLERHKPTEEVMWASDVDTACRIVATYLIDEDTVWLDHDAGAYAKDKDGVPCCYIGKDFRPVVWCLVACRFKGKVFVHSGNSVGRKWIIDTLRRGGIHAEDACIGKSDGESILD